MKISYLGHASFLIESGGKYLLTDPCDERCGYRPWTEPVDIVTVSHGHYDHNAVEHLKGNPRIIKEQITPIEAGGFTIQGFRSYHDKKQGQERGFNYIYKLTAENINLLHMGDQGTLLDQKLLEQIGQVDIVMVPVGGRYTVDAAEAVQIVSQLNPSIVIPMHYKTPQGTVDVAPVEKFISQYEQVVKRPALTVTCQELPEALQVIVLELTDH
ncbi:MAG TPA: MBL fold metallo-hydrolase [Syntrophomonadaceae bacterium]|nr:MBL fold metallo-hydrolase [Syntrophomonadaceae bacterium]HQA06613.1 MBL fold metallo-hydrolase [Syntrophomonadaceae bacterium]HQE22314.1 MBL fold metallo-hydrolase [Syntrophomonadaceae bacterium]